MEFVFSPYAVPSFITAIILLFFCLRTIRHSEEGGRIGQYILLMLLFAFWWSLVTFFASLSSTYSIKIIWGYLGVISFVAIPILFLLFALDLGGYKKGPNHWSWLLSLPGVLILTLAWTNSQHHWIWTRHFIGPEGTNSYIQVHGFLYWIIIAWEAVYYIVGVSILTHLIPKKNSIYRKPALVAFTAIILFLCITIFYSVNVYPLAGFDINHVATAAVVIILSLGTLKYPFFRLLPIARDQVFDELDEGVIVIDDQGNLVDFNPKAKDFTQNLFHLVLGEPVVLPLELESAFQKLKEQKHAVHDSFQFRAEIADQSFWLEMRVSSIYKARQLRGRILVLRNISEQKKLEQNLLDQAHKDPLTGLYNRRFMIEALEKETSRFERTGVVFSLVMIDLDLFKELNDQFGHDFGDQVLKDFSQLLGSYTRMTDIVCRWGGEEFLVLYQGSSLDETKKKIQELAKAYSEMKIDKPWNLSFSAGIVQMDAGRTDFIRLISLADRAMYQGKREGRNRIIEWRED